MAALFDRDRLAQCGFDRTRLFAALKHEPVGLIDVGARWGISEVFRPTAELFDVIAFEPDPKEAAELTQTASQTAPWAGLKILPHALADRRRNLTLHLLKRANNSSIFPVDMRWYERYALAGFELEKELQLPAVPLDEIVFGEGDHLHRGEILKIDTQGAELLILQGAERTLRERTLCLVCEASFFTVYQGAPLFSELELHLRQRGFSLYGFLDVQQRSSRRLDKRLTRGRERWMQADAAFFKDPFDQPISDARSLGVLVLAGLLFGFFDFALEVAERLPEGSHDIAKAIRELATVSPTKVSQQLTQLARQIDANPAEAAARLGRYVDGLRDFHTYHEVKLTEDKA
jgi:FkbM family methyltransferase